MKKIENFFQNHRVIVSLLMLMLAVVTGGGSMAAGAVIGSEGADPTTSDDTPDPVNPDSGTGQNPGDDPDGRLTPGDRTAGQNLDGTQASSTQITKGGMVEDEREKDITHFQAWRNPMLRLASEISETISIQNWSVKHARIGGETLDGYTKSKITPESDGSIKLNASNFRGSLRPFYKDNTILIPSIQGYAQGATSTNLVKEGGLMLIVTENKNGVVTCRAINGIPTEEVATEELDSRKCPDIPANTYLVLGEPVMSESQILLPPENFQPREEEFYVQKTGLNIVFTDDYEKAKKKYPIKVKDIKQDALYKFLMKKSRTMWAGVKNRFNKTNADGSVEYAYTTKGILWQLTNLYTYTRGGLALGDLIALSKLQHTTFSQSDTSYSFCGKDAIEELLKLKIENTDKTIDIKDTTEFDLKFKKVTTPFGEMNFVYDPGLDALGYKDAFVIVDLKGARRYVKMEKKEATNDMSKGAGEIREAKRYWRIEADGIALRGYNSILVVPSDKVDQNNIENQMRSKVISSATLPENPANGAIYALTADFELGGKTYKKGYAYQATVSGSVTWTEYQGYTSVII